jgi:hypothetical protein
LARENLKSFTALQNERLKISNEIIIFIYLFGLLSIQETDLVGKINAYIRHLITPQYEQVGWEEKGTHMER